MLRDEILKSLKKENVRYLRLWFTDIMGTNKNVEVPASQFEKALDGQIMFDGSSIEGFSRIEESDMLLVPDYDTFVVFPFEEDFGKTARVICDVKNPDGGDFAGCPRTILKKQCERAAKDGYTMMAGPEAEFFLFEKNSGQISLTSTHDSGGYFDLTPIDKGEIARRAMVEVLENIGFQVEAAHHEVAPGQHEIDFKYADALKTADNIATFRFVVRKVALDFNLHATFMPKPIFGINGSGMHMNQSLFKGKKNAFYDENAKWQLSREALNYIAGLIEHIQGFTAITNPLINSYKRLVPGYEAPTHIAWSERNRSPLIRVPARRGNSTRAELRSPDPSANPYLSLSVMLASGLEGIAKDLTPPEPISENIYHMSRGEREERGILSLPGDMLGAIEMMEKDAFIGEVLGPHITRQFLKAKRAEWKKYIANVHQWEIDHYLKTY